MGCGASTNQQPNDSANMRVRHLLVTETASPFTRIKAYDAIKNDDVILVQKILQEIPATENLGLTGENSTCLHVAAQQNSFQAMKALISWLKANKANEVQQILEITNSEGNTPVTVCIINDASETFYVMVSENVINRDYKTKKGETLSDLCHHHSFNCLELLEGKQKDSNKETQNIKKEEQKDKVQPNQQKEIINNTKPVDPEKEHREKKVDNIVAKVQKVQNQKNEEISNIKNVNKADTSAALQGVPTDSEIYKLITNFLKKGGDFEDPNFPRVVESITLDSTHKYYDRFKKAIWKRPHELFGCDYDQVSVFENIDANDIAQGLLGVCYLLSSLSALTEFPSRLTKMFLNKTANKYGAYSIQFYVKGVPTEIVIDDAFPCYGDRKNEPLFSKPKGKELWVLLAEKAWAKLFNNYVACEAGFMDEALEYMLGSPAVTYMTKKQETHEIFKTLSQGDQAKHILCAGTNANANKDMGLVAGHAYSIISVHNVGRHNLIKLRNPWGSFEWKGDFGDGSSLWTDELKAKVGYTNADDGVFCMTVDDFKKNFEFYSVGIFNEGWEYTYCEAESDPNHAAYFRFTIDQPCTAYFRIHQDDKRKLSEAEQKNHKYAGGDLTVAYVQDDGTYKPVLENSSDVHDSCIWGDRSIFPAKNYKIDLRTPGEYVIRTKLRWPSGQRDRFTLSSYSNIKIELEQIEPIKDFLPQFLTNIGRAGEKTNMTKGCDMSYEFYSHYFYLYFENSSEKTWTVNIDFTELQNLRMSKPHKKNATSMSVTVPPGESRINYLKKIALNEATSYGWKIKQTLH